VLIRSHRQEALSRAYIHAIAARCGLGCSFHEFDYGIDLTIHEIERVGTRYRESGFALDVQAKSTTSALATPDRVRYDMEVRAYDDLRQVNAGTPRILVLLVLPEDEGTWTEQQEDYLLESLRNNGMVDVTTVESPASSENAPKSQNGRNSESRPMLQRSSHYYATTLLCLFSGDITRASRRAATAVPAGHSVARPRTGRKNRPGGYRHSPLARHPAPPRLRRNAA
jgi:hypothetical protein